MAMSTFGKPSTSAGTLVGRRLELSWLRTRFALVADGFAHLVLIEGEQGIGKTRLANEAVADARRAGATVLRGRCYEHLDLAYLPLRESLIASLEQSLGRASLGAPVRPERSKPVGSWSGIVMIELS